MNSLLTICYMICCEYDGVGELVRRYEGLRKNKWKWQSHNARILNIFFVVLVCFNFFI